MRAVITRVLSASVTIDGKEISKIDKGFLVLLGVHVSDTEEQAKKIADKICGLRLSPVLCQEARPAHHG